MTSSLQVVRLLMIATVIGASTAVAVLDPSPAHAAIPPPPAGCPFILTFDSYQGAAGSEYLISNAVPVSPFERCSTTVTGVASLTSDSGVPYNNVEGNPSSGSLTLSFMPSRQHPQIGVRFTRHCADPASPGTLRLSVEGQSVSQPVPAESCFVGDAPPNLSLSVTPQRSFTGMASTPDGGGYNLVDDAGDVFQVGNATPRPTGFDPTSTAIASTPTGQGYWVAGTDGSVYTYGNANFYGSAFNLRLNAPVVSIVSTSDGGGYWLMAADGGVFAFGDAAFYGSEGGQILNAPIVGAAESPGGHGYWLVAADGGVFSFGDAPFDGSAGSLPLNAPVVGMAVDVHGGYWLAASDGGVFTYGLANFFGAAASLRLNAPISAITAAPDGDGYALLGADGGIFTYGSAKFFGSLAY